jgi:hypothetical protein
MRGASSEQHVQGLSEEQLQFWRDNGYLVVSDALSKETVAELLSCVHRSAEALATPGHEKVKEHTYDQQQKMHVSAVGRALAILTTSKPPGFTQT